MTLKIMAKEGLCIPILCHFNFEIRNKNMIWNS